MRIKTDNTMSNSLLFRAADMFVYVAVAAVVAVLVYGALYL